MKNYYMILFPMYSMSILFSLSSVSWMSIWIGMEMNLLTFIFLMLDTQTFNSTESAMKYFLIQAMSSMIFLITINTQLTFYSEMMTMVSVLPALALIMKSGLAPFHLWTPDIAFKLSPFNLYLFMTLQKLIPLVMLSHANYYPITCLIIMNLITGAIGGISQSSMNKMIIFSSINNSAWMLMSLNQSNMMFTLFFCVYSIINFLVITFIKTEKIKWISQIQSQKYLNKILFISSLMSLSGLPPFLGFFPKWMILKKICLTSPLVSITSIIMASITLFFYLKFCVTLMVTSTISKKWKFSHTNWKPWFKILVLNICSPTFFVLLA